VLTRPDAHQYQALARLARNPDGEVLLALLDTELRRLQLNLLDSSGDVTSKLQGRASEVYELIELLRGAPAVAEKSRQPKA
jgi:hypothetical protein